MTEEDCFGWRGTIGRWRDSFRPASRCKPVVMIGGVAASVGFSGLSPGFVGVNQLNVAIPAGVAPGDAAPLQIKVGGITTTALATLAIH